MNRIKFLTIVLVLNFVASPVFGDIILLPPSNGDDSGHPNYYLSQELNQALNVFGINTYLTGENRNGTFSLNADGKVTQGTKGIYYEFQGINDYFSIYSSDDYSKYGEKTNSVERFSWNGSIDFIIRKNLPEDTYVNYQGNHNFNIDALRIYEHSCFNINNAVDWNYDEETDEWKPTSTDDYEFSFHSHIGAENSSLFFPVLENISINVYDWNHISPIGNSCYDPMLSIQFSADGYFSQVPEPATLCILSFGGLVLARRRNKISRKGV